MLSYTGVLTTGTTPVIAAPTSPTFIRVLGYQLTSKDTDATVTLKSNTTAKANVLVPAAGVGGICCPPGKEPYFDCAAGVALNVTLSASGSLAVNIQYALIS